jgi:hypothetical protein
MKAVNSDILQIQAHLPRAARPVVLHWMRRNPSVQVQVSPPRTSKLGDYRWPRGACRTASP